MKTETDKAGVKHVNKIIGEKKQENPQFVGEETHKNVQTKCIVQEGRDAK